MSLQRWSSRTALIILAALAGCAAVPPEPLPPPTSPADLLRAATEGDTTAVAITAPSSAHPTLPEFLGIPQCCAAMQRCCSLTASQIAFCFPGLAGLLDGFQPVLPLDDPANLSESAPESVSKAAEIKAQEDQAAQKIAALRYLATIGCGGCYPSVEDAFISGLEDCTEEVRWEAVKALRDTSTNACAFCNEEACCSEKIQKKLRELAMETDDSGCPKEPSDRVRRQARLALAECGPPPPEPQPVVDPGIEEGRPAEAPLEGQDAPPPGVEPDVEVEAEGPLTQNGNKSPAAGTTSAAVASTSGHNSQPGNTSINSQGGAPVGSQMPVFPWSIKR